MHTAPADRPRPLFPDLCAAVEQLLQPDVQDLAAHHQDLVQQYMLAERMLHAWLRVPAFARTHLPEQALQLQAQARQCSIHAMHAGTVLAAAKDRQWRLRVQHKRFGRTWVLNPEDA